MTASNVNVFVPNNGQLFVSAVLPLLAEAFRVELPAAAVSVRESDEVSAPTAEGGARLGALHGDLPVAICLAQALARASPQLLGSLCGATPFECAEHAQWLRYLAEYAGDGGAVAATVLPALDAHLAVRSFLVGYELTLADLYCAALVRDKRAGVPADRLKRLRATHRHFSRWLHLVENLPYVAAAVQRAGEAASRAVGGWDAVGRLVGAAGSFEVALPNAEYGRVVTRFPPEPSGYLHVGHTKALLLNDYFARVYGGRMILRFDDTNPSKEKSEYEESILADCGSLGVKTDVVEHTSDYFAQLLEWCSKFIRDGNAYVDATPVEQMREQRLRGEASEYRERSVEENMRAWQAMQNGEEAGRGCCVRAKIDMQAKNAAMRDPVIYRAASSATASSAAAAADGSQPAPLPPPRHHRTGDRFKVYPSYDFACPIVDSLAGVTHALRTSEYQDREAQYYWMCDAAGLRRPTIWAYSRLSFVKTVLSKRKLTWMVDNGVVDGWDDPRMPTVRGMLRRGLQVDALRAFILSQGASKNITVQEWDKIWTINKRVVDPVAARHTAISASAHRTLLIDNLDGAVHDGRDDTAAAADAADALPRHRTKAVPRYKKNPELGTKVLVLDREAILEADDAATFTAGEYVTLMDLGNVRIDSLGDADADAMRCTFLPDDTDFKKTKKVTWLARVPDLVPVELVQYRHLLRKAKLEEDDALADWVNSNEASKSVEHALADMNVCMVPRGSVIQFERRGYHRCDTPYVRRGEPMRFIEVPDGRNETR